MLRLINEQRKLAGEEEVELDEELNAVAQKHAQDMVNREYLAHINF